MAGGNTLKLVDSPEGGKATGGALIIEEGEPDLLEIVRALPRRAASRADCTAGKRSAIKTAMMAMTTKSSIRVNALEALRCSSETSSFYTLLKLKSTTVT